MENKIWFVTDASKGLGLTLVKRLLKEGYNVAATSRTLNELVKATQKPGKQFLPLEVNLIDEASVKKALKKTVDHFGRIDVVVNNAGYGLVGGIEEITDEEARKNFDVNVFGVLNVIRNVLPILRSQMSGYILNISSIAGFVGFDGSGIYCATKFALDGISESLCPEIAPFGIKVTSVKPGSFRTKFLSSDSLRITANLSDAYNVVREARLEFLREKDGHQSGDPEKVAEFLIDLSKDPHPPLHVFLGKDAYEMARRRIECLKEDMRRYEKAATSTDVS